MKSIEGAIKTIKHIDELAYRDRWINRVSPPVKLFFLVFYIAFIMNINKYSITTVILSGIIPVVFFTIADISVKETFVRLRVTVPFIILISIANLFTDKMPYAIGQYTISSGVITMLTLMLKCAYAVIMSYVFVATTPIERLCRSLRRMHVPEIIVTEIMLTYRYIGVLLDETGKVVTAYSLRAPGQKGVAFKVWGSLSGQMLLKSMDRAESIYESMQLRGMNAPGDTYDSTE